MSYDSRPDTTDHIDEVRARMRAVVADLEDRLVWHDASKLESPEVEVFDEYTPKLKDSTYGSDEYKEFLVGMGEGLKHHYAVNRHHPEHFAIGIDGMNLLDLIEMLCDWKAATMRHTDGDLGRSIEQNAERFGYDDTMQTALYNTARYLRWL